MCNKLVLLLRGIPTVKAKEDIASAMGTGIPVVKRVHISSLSDLQGVRSDETDAASESCGETCFAKQVYTYRLPERY